MGAGPKPRVNLRITTSLGQLDDAEHRVLRVGELGGRREPLVLTRDAGVAALVGEHGRIAQLGLQLGEAAL